LFELSKPTLVKTLNALFHENYDPDSVDIKMASTEYHKNNLDTLRADICITITQYKPYHYHIEVQTEPQNMALRMFEYDIMEALRNYRLENTTTPDVIDLFLPKSIVIQIEDGGNVPKDFYSLNLRLANGQLAQYYTVPVMRYFEYDSDRLIKENLFNLLPLQIFQIRAELDKKTKDNSEDGRQAAILKARDISQNVAELIVNLYAEQKFNDVDMDKMMIAVSACFKHLNNRYNVNEKLNKEIDTMVRSLIDANTWEKLRRFEQLEQEKNQAKQAEQKLMARIVEITKKMLKKNLPISEITEITGLTEKEISEIEKAVEAGD